MGFKNGEILMVLRLFYFITGLHFVSKTLQK